MQRPLRCLFNFDSLQSMRIRCSDLTINDNVQPRSLPSWTICRCKSSLLDLHNSELSKLFGRTYVRSLQFWVLPECAADLHAMQLSLLNLHECDCVHALRYQQQCEPAYFLCSAGGTNHVHLSPLFGKFICKY